MKKLIVLGGLLMIVLSGFSEIDTLERAYPILAYPPDKVEDTCVLLTPTQARYAAEDGINADYYQAITDSQKRVIQGYRLATDTLKRHISLLQTNNKNYVKLDSLWKKKEKIYSSTIVAQDKKLKLTKLGNAVSYPILITLIVGLTLGIIFGK